MGHIKFISGAVMAGIFVIVLIIFATQFAADNDSDISLANDSKYTTLQSQLTSNISQFNSDSNSSSNSFYGTQLESGDEHSATGAQFKVGPGTAVKLSASSFKTSFEKLTGGDSNFTFIMLSFGALLAYISVLYAYKAWFGRNPD